jgi:hypothetical protein
MARGRSPEHDRQGCSGHHHERVTVRTPIYPWLRVPEQDLALDGNHVYVGTDGCGVEVIDLFSGQRRRSVLQDVTKLPGLQIFYRRWPFIGSCLRSRLL